MARIDETRPFIPVNIAILTVSDTRTLANDTSGDALAERVGTAGHRVAERAIEKDDAGAIERLLRAWIADGEIDVVITTGGTGITGRDVTPEAFDRVLEKRIEGFGELFRMLSYQKIGTSTMQSRALGGVAGGTYLFALARQHRRGEGRLGRHTGVPAGQPVSPLQPGGADAAATGTSQDCSGVAARATIASRSLRIAAPRARAAWTTSAGAVSGVPASNGGAGAYSICN